MKQYYYFYAGLEIVSDLPIPEWDVFEYSKPSNNIDVFISLENSLNEESKIEENLPFISSNNYRFYIPSIGTYRVENGRKITVAPVSGANPQAVRLYLLGSAMGALYYQRGFLSIYASVLQIGNTSVAFCGTVGAGKSTMVAHLTRKGYNLVCDDLCRLDLSKKDQISVWPAAPSFKLWQDTIDSLGWDNKTMERDHVRYDKFHVPLGDEHPLKYPMEPIPLSAIYILDWGEWSIKRLYAQDALTRFITAATYRHELIEPMNILGSYWGNCLKVATHVPIFELNRSRNLLIMNQNIDLLKAHWAENKILDTKEVITA